MVELLMYMGILTVLLTTLTSIFVSAMDVQSESQATSSVEQDGNYILARLGYDIHRAQNISIPANDGDVVNNDFKITINGVSYEYKVDGSGNLVLIVNDVVSNNLNNYDTIISNFFVRRLGSGGRESSLKINFAVTSRTKRISNIETKSFETNLSLRRQ